MDELAYIGAVKWQMASAPPHGCLACVHKTSALSQHHLSSPIPPLVPAYPPLPRSLEWVIDARQQGNTLRFANHSTSANCRAE